MSNQSFKAPKAARRKVTTDLGRQIMQRERQRLAREQAALGEQLADEAKRALAKRGTHKRQVQPEQIAVSRGIVRRFAAVLQSEGVNVTIKATPSSDMSAWTDFEQIVINYRMHDDVRLLAATMRGLAYHEGGHCRFTIPFVQLIEATGVKYDRRTHDQYHKAWNMLEDQRMETAVVSDSPRKAAYLTPTIMTEMAENVNAAAANWPLFIFRKYLPRKIRKGARTLFVAKHNLMGMDGEALAKGWERVVTEYVMADNAQAMWTAVLTAHQLLQMTQTVPAAQGDMGHNQQTHAERDNLDDALVIPIDPGMLDDGTMIDVDSDPIDIDTTDPAVAEHLANIFVALFNHPETLLRVVYAVPQKSDKPAEGSGSSSAPSDDESDESDESEADEDEADDSDGDGTVGGSKDDDSDEADETEGKGQSDDSDEATAEDEGDEDDDAGSEYDDDDDDEDERYANDGERESGVDPEREGGSEGKHDEEEVDADLDYKPVEDDDDEELSDDDLEEALAEAEAERDDDDALDGDVHAFQDVLDTRVSDLMPYVTHASTDYEATAASHNLADDLEQSFYAATMDKAPAWLEQQRRGVLNVMRYVTRQPGDVEVFKQWTEDAQPGFNISVSLLLDYSGSMGGYTSELAQAGYATKLACSKLGIPCTVTLWDTGAQILWDANEEAEYLPVIESAGGTDPSVALADLPNQRFDKAQHIVLIMTDGEWSGSQANNGYLAAYNEQGRIFIGCGFNSGYGTADALADKLRRYGCDESYAVKSLMEIPQLLQQTLVAVA